MWKKRNAYRILEGKPYVNISFEDRGGGGRIILKRV
jgi:hypothetical protein